MTELRKTSMDPRDYSVTDLTRCALALLVFGVSGTAVIFELSVPEWWQFAAGAVAGFYFGMEYPNRNKG